MTWFDPATFLPFVLTCTIIELTPGPNMAYLALLSASQGRKPGFAATAGIATGLFIVGAAAAFGLATMVADSAVAYHMLRVAGVFYLLWLAWEGWQGSEASLPDAAGHTMFFRRGLVTNLLNPKAALFYVGILPNFLNVALDVQKQAVVLMMVYVMIATIIHSLIVVLAGTAHAFLNNRRRRFIVRRAFSALLALIALWFAAASARPS